MTWVQPVAVMIVGLFGLGVVLLLLSPLVGNRDRQLRIRWLGRIFRASALLLAPVSGGLVLMIETPADLGILALGLRLAGAVVIVATLIAGLWIARRAQQSIAVEIDSQPKK